jgi:prevent-host-death family protein
MPEMQLEMAQVKRDLAKLVNRVADGDGRIVLTSCGKPKAAWVSLADYEWLREQDDRRRDQAQWQAWREAAEKLNAAILERRGGRPLDVDVLWASVRSDLEARDARVLPVSPGQKEGQ